MKGKQHYGNHKQFNILYYVVLLPLCTLFLILTVFFAIQKGFVNQLWLEAGYFVLSGSILILISIIMRQQALVNQKRIIRLEMRLRYYILTSKPFNPLEIKLTTGQIEALRFASDAELLSLVEITLEEQLAPDQIKKKIKRWKGDYHQV